MSVAYQSLIARAKGVMLLFFKLRGIECLSIFSVGAALDVMHQLRAGVFPQIPLAAFMVPLGLYIGFGYFAIVAIAFFPLVLCDSRKSVAAILLANTLPIAVFGIFVFHSLYNDKYPIWLICIWSITVLVNIISVYFVENKLTMGSGSRTPV